MLIDKRPHPKHPGTLQSHGPLTVERVAEWLELQPDSVRQIERRRYGLTQESAEILADKTGAQCDWLLTGNPNQPRNAYGGDFTQEFFDSWQLELTAPGRAEAGVQRDIQHAFGIMALVFLHAYQMNKSDFCFRRVRMELLKIDEQLGTFEPDTVVGKILHCQPTQTRPDLKPVVDEWERRFKEVMAGKRRGKLT